MCFKKPKIPKPTAADIQVERDATNQRELALEEQRRQRTANKADRYQMAVSSMGQRIGRASLLTGGRGGIGYAAPTVRSLLSVS